MVQHHSAETPEGIQSRSLRSRCPAKVRLRVRHTRTGIYSVQLFNVTSHSDEQNTPIQSRFVSLDERHRQHTDMIIFQLIHLLEYLSSSYDADKSSQPTSIILPHKKAPDFESVIVENSHTDDFFIRESCLVHIQMLSEQKLCHHNSHRT